VWLLRSVATQKCGYSEVWLLRSGGNSEVQATQKWGTQKCGYSEVFLSKQVYMDKVADRA